MPIEFSHVSFTYNPKSKIAKKALDDVSFKIEEGEFVALIGRTGCGKSTLVQHINALLEPEKGEVIVDEFISSSDKKRRSKKLHQVRKSVGVVFQFSESQLFEETIEKDVAFAPKNFGDSQEEAYRKAHEALAKVGLGEEFYKRSPFELSGGEKRRAAIAGILAYGPKYLILDEPTAGLDPSGAKAMMDLFRFINESGTTILFVTHDMNLVLGYANRAIVMDKGKVVRDSSPFDLFKENLEDFSLETPPIFALAKALNEKGMKIDKESLKDVSLFADNILKNKGGAK